jgi:hypothetical protein
MIALRVICVSVNRIERIYHDRSYIVNNNIRIASPTYE